MLMLKEQWSWEVPDHAIEDIWYVGDLQGTAHFCTSKRLNLLLPYSTQANDELYFCGTNLRGRVLC